MEVMCTIIYTMGIMASIGTLYQKKLTFDIADSNKRKLDDKEVHM